MFMSHQFFYTYILSFKKKNSCMEVSKDVNIKFKLTNCGEVYGLKSYGITCQVSQVSSSTPDFSAHQEIVTSNVKPSIISDSIFRASGFSGANAFARFK